MNFLEMFPKPQSSPFRIDNYMKYFEENQWKLHGLNRSNETWPNEYYRKVIESIFMNILTSNFIVSIDSDLNGHILDGGHRTLAIQKFMNNEIKVKIGEEYKAFSELSELLKKRFKSNTINVVQYENLNPSQEEELFFKLNICLPLSPGECINAYHTIPMCILAKECSFKYAKVLSAKFCRAVEKNDSRCDSSNLCMNLLENFYYNKIRHSERLTEAKQEDNKSRCEVFRNVEINKDDIQQKMRKLFECFPEHPERNKFKTYVIYTVQNIIIQDPEISPNEIKKWLKYEVINPSNIWTNCTRENKSNPNMPAICERRAKAFYNWRRNQN